jgi:hypothetical protein
MGAYSWVKLQIPTIARIFSELEIHNSGRRASQLFPDPDKQKNV